MINILKDYKFEKGFHIGHIDSVNHKETVFEWCFKNELPDWKICQWCSKFPLYEYSESKRTLTEFTLWNDQKIIQRRSDGSLLLRIMTEKEYQHPRCGNEAWPHLLLEQFFENEKLSEIDKLKMSVKFSFEDFIDHMDPKDRNDMHTLQVSWYLAIGNKNKNSKGCGDFFWFGLPLIDHPRYSFPKLYEACDAGKEDSTQKYIVAIDPHKYMERNNALGKYDISFEAIDEIKRAYKVAREKGYLKDTSFEDLELISMNLGFEATGTFSGTIVIENISLEK